MLTVLPLILAVSYFYSKTVRARYKRIRESLSDLNIAATENIDGNRVVKAFTRERYEEEKFDEKSREYKDANVAASVAWSKVVPFLNFFSQSLAIFNLLVGGMLVISGDMTLGGLAMFNSLAWALSSPMNSISNLLNDLQRFFTSAEKVVEITEDTPIICDRFDAVPVEGKIKGNLEFCDVSFSYKNSQKILDRVSVKIDAGQTVAIMGRTGCGKTTLVNLIARFYDPSEGKILFDGVDLRYRRLADIHRSVAIATQDVFLFSDTVDGNIAFSNTSMPEEKVYEYATLAGADGFIKRMESGYETIIGERGVGISGGQRQRIALARALAAEPSVLVLDDTTSAVDTDTEAYIQNSLRNLPFECTKIIIAQRISSVKDADMIIIMENGGFCVGTHDTLVRTNAYYRELCELQNVTDLPAFEGEVREGGEA
jgi:ATP-binding cassette subfamily B protein